MSQDPCTLFWPPERIHADAVPADVAGRHGEIRHAHDHRGALAVLGHPEAVVDGRVAARGVQAGGRSAAQPPEHR